ncbi:class I SAM-dependent methyltransferase [bacterium]|nr:MAG: class I SAM-dependent methyltransferase [bacterium]
MNLNELFEKAIVHREQHQCSAYPYESYDRLFEIVTVENPDRILEIGSGCGFSACVMMLASPRLQLDSIEKDPEHVKAARQFLQENLTPQAAGRVRIIEGIAEEVLERLTEGYDLIFFDGYQIHYEFLPHYKRLLKAGGLLVLGNTHLSSKTSDNFFAELSNGKDGKIMDRFAETILARRI